MSLSCICSTDICIYTSVYVQKQEPLYAIYQSTQHPSPARPPQEREYRSVRTKKSYLRGAGPALSADSDPFPGVTGVIEPSLGVAGAGVGAREGTLLLLCAMCALTRWPAHRALLSDSSPARTPAAMTRASCLALSPGDVGCAPRTPRRSSIADWGSRMVPPPIVPTSIEGMETEIWRFPFTLG